jgi:ATP-dependent protease ClpP protease subunit
MAEVLELGKPKVHSNGYFPSKPISTVHEFYLTGEIGSPDEYIEWFDAIRHASENDAIKIYINSFGGDLFTAIQFLRVLSDTAATVVCSVEGACMSAATMIFLSADHFEVTPHSIFMFHNYSGGTIGKGGEMIDQLQHERKWSERLMKEIYKDFMSAEEIKSMLENKDIWMDGEDVVKRIEAKIKKAEKPAAPKAKAKPAARKPRAPKAE